MSRSAAAVIIGIVLQTAIFHIYGTLSGKLQDQRRVIGQPGNPIPMGIADAARASDQLLRQEGMVDAEPIILVLNQEYSRRSG